MSGQEIDLRSAINAVSDVVQNRPRPLRHVDQIYMKTGDMVLQSEIVAKWADGKSLAFIGDGDAISVCVALMRHRGILDFGPRQITVFDFDERIGKAVTRFADQEGITTIDSALYNCIDAFPSDALGKFDCFYTNPPWGASNKGESVKVFMQRGFEATRFGGEGMVVIADDHAVAWPQQVLAAAQSYALSTGHYIQRMQSRMHLYHLDDDPGLRSCNLLLKALPDNPPIDGSEPISGPRLKNFYGRTNMPSIHYIREKMRVDYGKAHDDEYSMDMYESDQNEH